jgi:hypothetical protein
LSGALVTAALAPILGSPDLRAELTSQVPLGHALEVREERGRFLLVRLADAHEGWVHRGYVAAGPDDWVAEWAGEAHAVSVGAVGSVDGRFRVLLPLGARLTIGPDGALRLPDGRIARVASGRVAPESTLRDEARAMSPDRWAEIFFGGAPYLWGGVTPWGVDCSGLVQVAFRFRGVLLPRDSAAQARYGEPVAADDAVQAFEPGDLLFFAEDGDRISHTGIAGADGTLVHASAEVGGVVRSPLTGESREAVTLRNTFRAARRVGG